MKKCLSCPISIGWCQLICCPKCAYSFPPESQLILWLKKLFKIGKNMKQDEERDELLELIWKLMEQGIRDKETIFKKSWSRDVEKAFKRL